MWCSLFFSLLFYGNYYRKVHVLTLIRLPTNCCCSQQTDLLCRIFNVVYTATHGVLFTFAYLLFCLFLVVYLILLNLQAQHILSGCSQVVTNAAVIHKLNKYFQLPIDACVNVRWMWRVDRFCVSTNHQSIWCFFFRNKNCKH